MIKKEKPFGVIDDFIISFSYLIPWSYYGILKGLMGKEEQTILDVGCGNGTFMYVFNKDRKFKVTGIDIFEEDLKKAEKLNIYNKLVKGDVTKLKFGNKSFDIVISNHVIEHLTKNDGQKFLNKLEKVAKRKVIVITPLGFRKQEGYSGNVFQEHKSGWYPKDFIKRGYSVIGQGLSVYYTNKPLNILLRLMGPINNFFFVFHILAQPLIGKKFIKYAHQIICVKEIV